MPKKNKNNFTHPLILSYLKDNKFKDATSYIKFNIQAYGTLQNVLMSAVDYCCYQGNDEIFNLFCKYKPYLIKDFLKNSNDDFFGYYPIHFALISGSKSLVGSIIGTDDSVVNQIAESRTLMTFIIEECNFLGEQYIVNILDVIFRYDPVQVTHICPGCDISPMIAACTNDLLEVCKWLYEKGAVLDISKPSEYSKETALSKACSSGNLTICEWLLSKGLICDINKPIGDAWGYYPIHYAAQEGCLNICEWLYKNNANINPSTKHGCKPIHYSAYKNIDTCKFFIDLGISVNEKDKDGETPIYYACEENNIETAEFLLNNGAIINIKNNKGNNLIINQIYSKSSNYSLKVGSWLISKNIFSKYTDLKQFISLGFDILLGNEYGNYNYYYLAKLLVLFLSNKRKKIALESKFSIVTKNINEDSNINKLLPENLKLIGYFFGISDEINIFINEVEKRPYTYMFLDNKLNDEIYKFYFNEENKYIYDLDIGL